MQSWCPKGVIGQWLLEAWKRTTLHPVAMLLSNHRTLVFVGVVVPKIVLLRRDVHVVWMQRWVSDARAVRFDRSHIVLGRREDERALPDESMLPMCCKLMHHVRVMHVNTRSRDNNQPNPHTCAPLP